MDFIESICRYQVDGERTVIESIREAMKVDYLAYKKTGGTIFERPEMYIAFTILRTIGGRLSTIKYVLTEEGWVDPLTEIKSYETLIGQYENIKLDPSNNFKSFLNNPSKMEDAKGILGDYGYAGLCREIVRYLKGSDRRGDLIQEEINALYFPLLLPALEFAISKVDVERSEREIVKYINKAFRTEYYRIQIESKGLKRVRRKDKAGKVSTKYVLPTETHVGYAMLGSWERMKTRDMSAHQRKLYDRIYEIVTEDFKNKEYDEYHIDRNSKYRVKNRYIAKRLGMHEVSISRFLKSIRKR